MAPAIVNGSKHGSSLMRAADEGSAVAQANAKLIDYTGTVRGSMKLNLDR